MPPMHRCQYQWPNKTYNAPMRPYKVGKKPSVKADLAIYSHVVNASGQCMSESLILGFNLDFSSCAILCKSSHIQIPEIDHVIKAKSRVPMRPVAVCKWPIFAVRNTTCQKKVSEGKQSHICGTNSCM